MSVSDEAARTARNTLAFLGLPDSEPLMQHLAVLQKAMLIYDERSDSRGELWARFDVHDSFAHARSKLARIGAMLQTMELAGGVHPVSSTELDNINDEIIDLINYAVFMYRHVNPRLKPRVEPIDL